VIVRTRKQGGGVVVLSTKRIERCGGIQRHPSMGCVDATESSHSVRVVDTLVFKRYLPGR